MAVRAPAPNRLTMSTRDTDTDTDTDVEELREKHRPPVGDDPLTAEEWWMAMAANFDVPPELWEPYCLLDRDDDTADNPYADAAYPVPDPHVDDVAWDAPGGWPPARHNRFESVTIPMTDAGPETVCIQDTAEHEDRWIVSEGGAVDPVNRR